MSIDMEDIYARMIQEQKARAAEAKANRDAKAPQLLAEGFTSVEWEYDGYDDSGSVQTAKLFKNQEESEASGELDKFLNQMAYMILEGAYPGWEINEGSSGTMRWDLASNKVVIEHGQRVEEVVHDTKEV